MGDVPGQAAPDINAKQFLVDFLQLKISNKQKNSFKSQITITNTSLLFHRYIEPDKLHNNPN